MVDRKAFQSCLTSIVATVKIGDCGVMALVRVQFVLIFAQPTKCSSVCGLRSPNDLRQPVTKPELMSYPLITYLSNGYVGFVSTSRHSFSFLYPRDYFSKKRSLFFLLAKVFST